MHVQAPHAMCESWPPGLSEISDIGLAICRSLMAAYEMLRLGYTNISVLKGGFSEWKRNER